MNGGIDGRSTHRLAAQAARVSALELDVLFVQEAKHWREEGGRGLHIAELDLRPAVDTGQPQEQETAQ